MSSTSAVSTGLGISFQCPENTDRASDARAAHDNPVSCAKGPFDETANNYRPAETSRGSSWFNSDIPGDRGDRIAKRNSCMVSDYQDGRRVVHDSRTPNQCSLASLIVSERPVLSRHGTLLSAGATPERNAAELKSILGTSNSRLKPGAALLPLAGQLPSDSDKTSLEQAKTHARVEVDIVLESNNYVQGGYLQGQIKVRIRKWSKKNPTVLISAGKVRVIGFECISDENDRHPFYQCSSSLSSVTTNSGCLYTSPPDAEGYASAAEGRHTLPFSMLLPMSADHGVPKGTSYLQSRIAVRYVAMVSIKVKEDDSNKRSIAHFYRDCEIWPRLNPSVVLAPAEKPLEVSVSKGLFMGGPGKVDLSASLHRLHWIAGQQCYVKVDVLNDTKKTINALNLALIRSVVVFKTDRCQTSTTQKQVAESVLEMAQRGTTGRASAKGWWAGVGPGEHSTFSQFILIPPDALTVTRSRLLEVDYSIQVTLSAGTLRTADVQVSLPLHIINFISLDPPSNFPLEKYLPQDQPTSLDDIYLRNSGASTRANSQLSRPPVTAIFDSYGPNSRTLESVAEADDEQLSSPDRGVPATISQNQSLMLDDPYDGIGYESENDHCGEPEPCSMYANPNEDLGDLSMYEDDDDEVVQYVPDPSYENAPRFADLYHVSVQEDSYQSTVHGVQDDANLRSGWKQEDRPEDPQEFNQQSQNNNLPLRPNSRPPTVLTRPGRPRGPSSFPQRVQYKIEAAAANVRKEAARGHLDYTEDGMSAVVSAVPVSVPSSGEVHPHISPYPIDHRDNNFEGGTHSSGYEYTQSASSSLSAPPTIPSSDSVSSLPYRRTDGSGFISSSSGSGGSRLLPRPPSLANLPTNNQSDSETIITTAASTGAAPTSSLMSAFPSRQVDGPTAITGTPIRPSLSALCAQGGGSASGSTSSVKDKIRELEEKQRLLALGEADGIVPFV